jgi:hypothetical protein
MTCLRWNGHGMFPYLYKLTVSNSFAVLLILGSTDRSRDTVFVYGEPKYIEKSALYCYTLR